MPKGVYKQSYEKVCTVCKTVYITQHNKSIYCSGTCRNVVWRNQNRNKYRLKQQQWILNNPKQHQKNQYEYKRNQLKTNPLAKLRKTLRVRLYTALTKNQLIKTGKLKDYLGCSITDLKVYLENQFMQGTTWGNHGQWHIDHIIPLASATNEQEMLKLCHYTNLQPLWAKDNLSKGDRI